MKIVFCYNFFFNLNHSPILLDHLRLGLRRIYLNQGNKIHWVHIILSEIYLREMRRTREGNLAQDLPPVVGVEHLRTIRLSCRKNFNIHNFKYISSDP